MLKVINNKILINRGDIAVFAISAEDVNEDVHVFKIGDVIRFRIMKNNDASTVFLQKDVKVEYETTTVDLYLDANDTTIGELINRPVNYWYEVELNPDTAPQTIIGYDDKGPKLFVLYPEGKKIDD